MLRTLLAAYTPLRQESIQKTTKRDRCGILARTSEWKDKELFSLEDSRLTIKN